jgi:hypothetical protein
MSDTSKLGDEEIGGLKLMNDGGSCGHSVQPQH